MARRVENIERIMGVPRHPHKHIGMAVSDEEQFYIMHSQECLDTGRDLLLCPYTVALDDYGIDIDGILWKYREDVPYVLDVVAGELVPLVVAR